ncbi:ABC transporter substrate-binding protein [Kutzneria albida]|uniref:Dipeptide/oligopeptide ABC transporter periplasmic protein n=1 Tax=Kutzneria albida DSM 43870 TaxID=1449976 RepID=W5W1A0_9PSEU|nr:ABC transporter substrate-binding protein [Kutzneria albida]AHH94565.1 dipeptide/oligopeptide ABC transporter periplasmic protein [Kutzneria albida DSM 43870]
MRVKRSVVLVLAGALALTGLAACGGGAKQANTGAVLNVGMPNGPQTNNSNPFIVSSAAFSLGYRRMIYEPLVMTNAVRVTEPGKPWLATKWDWSENYHKLVLTIRDGVKFSDGQPMTAEDVAYTFQLLKDNPGLNYDALRLGGISVSGNQVTLTFDKSQFVNQVKILRTFVVPKHVWSKVANPTTDTVANPVGTGPYTLKSFTPQTVTLTVRDSYWQDLPKVKELRYTSYNDNNAQTTALGNGSCEWSFTFIPNYKAVYTSKDPEHFKLWFPAMLAVHGLWFNTERKPFDNPVLRRAMSMVVNRDDIFNQGEAGYFYPKADNVTGIPTPAGDSFIAPEYQGKTMKVDIAGAKKLLTDNGFRYQGDTLLDTTGKPVTLTLSNPSGWSDYITDLEILRDNFAKIGITATVDKANQDAWLKAVDTGNFDAVMHWTNDGATPYDLYQNIMDASLYKPVGTGGVSGNYGRFSSPEGTQALQRYAEAADDAGRAAALATVQKIMVEQQPVIATSAANAGGEYSTRNWVGWPDEQNPYGPAQPTLINALDIVLHLKPAS